MVEMTAIVRNADGIHCRPSVMIVKSVVGYAGQVMATADRGRTDLRSVMSLMTLALGPGARVTIRVTGPDESDMCARLVKLFETHFDFPRRSDGDPPLVPPDVL